MSAFSNIKFYWTNNGEGKVKARGTVDVVGTLTVNFSLMEGKFGLFVGLPGRYVEKNGQKEWFSDVRTTSKELTTDLNKAIVAAWEQEQSGGSQAPDVPASDDQDIPF